MRRDSEIQGIIYKATNRVNGKVYIGQTVQPLQKRKKQHTKTKEVLGRAIRKHGAENFTFVVIDNATDKESLNRKEAFWVSFFGSMSPRGYNLTAGGEANTIYSQESREKMSCAAKKRIPESTARLLAANKGRIIPPEEREKRSKAQLGRKASAETIAKLVAVRKNRAPVTDETRAKMAEAGRKRKPISDETRAKLVEVQKNRKPISDEARAKITASKLGFKYSEESRAKMSASAKARKVSPETRAKMAATRTTTRQKITTIEIGE